MGDFPPIVTWEEWYRAQEIKAGRVKENFSAKKGKKTTHCVQENRDLWGNRLRCTCGCSFRKNVWHKYDDKPNTYGYQCYNILNNGSANQRRKAGADDTGYSDQGLISNKFRPGSKEPGRFAFSCSTGNQAELQGNTGNIDKILPCFLAPHIRNAVV